MAKGDSAVTEIISQEEQLRLFEGSPVVIYTCRPDGDFGATFVSNGIRAQLGWEPQEFLAAPEFWTDHIHPDDRERVFTGLPKLFEEGQYSHQYRFLHNDGSYRWMSDVLRLDRDENGIPVRIVGYWTEITRLKEVENELRHAHDGLERRVEEKTSELREAYDALRAEIAKRNHAVEGLRESEARLRAVMDHSPMAIILKDCEGHYLLANRTWHQWFNPGGREIAGKTVYDFFPKDYADLVTAQNREVMETGTMVEIEHEPPFVNGTIRNTIIYKFPIVGPDHEIIGICTIEPDISHRKQIEAQLRHTQKMEAVGQLTGGIAHEFNNLLLVIVGNLEMTLRRLSDDSLRPMLSSAMNEAMRGGELTKQLLAFSRKVELKAEYVDLNRLVRGMGDMLQRTLGETISVESELAEDLWRVLADAGQISGALLNLSLNARDAMAKGGRIIVTTSNRSLGTERLAAHPNVIAGDYVMLEVADTGSGMAPEILGRAFDPFYTTKDVGEGTGLGLSMVHGFVQQSGGFLEIDSVIGSGTRVMIYLPRAEERADTLIPIVAKTAPAPDIDGTVLVVEDDPYVRLAVVQLLTDLGCAAVEAEDGQSALARLNERSDIDVLFTDVVLPHGLSGPDIAREALVRYPGLKVLFTSGYPNAGGNDFRKGENSWFLQKPYQAAELVETLVNVLKS